MSSKLALDRLDSTRTQITHFRQDPRDEKSLSDDLVRSVYLDSRGDLWIGTLNGGLNRYLPATNEFRRYVHDPADPTSLSDNYVRTIYEDSSGVLWICTFDGGLNMYDRQTGTFEQYRHDPGNSQSLRHERVILEDSAGGLWIGAIDGLDHLDRDRNSWTHYSLHRDRVPDALPGFPYSIFEDSSGRLWFGGDAGLSLLDRRTNRFTHYTESDGLPNDVVYAILEDHEGNLWLSTNNGLSEFNPDQLTFKNYDASDGLQSNEFNARAAFVSDDGELFFGGVNGVTAFHPETIRDNPHIPEVKILDLRIFNESVPIGEGADGRMILDRTICDATEVELSYRDSVFTLEFAALHYAQPEQNQYAYMMEGFDSDWSYVGNRRFATYTNLPPGTYTFRVKAANYDGVWNERGATLVFVVTPPFWGTWWFRVVCAVVVLISIFGVVQARTHSISKRATELELTIDRRTSELRQSERDYRELFERAHDPILIISVEGRFILDANQRAFELYGYDRHEMIGLRMDTLVKDPTTTGWCVEQIVEHGLTHGLERAHLKQDGTEMIVEINASVVDYKGQQAVLSICRDTTERRQLEEQLMQAQKMETIGQLAGGVAHDFNNQLTAIICFTELAKLDASDHEKVVRNLNQVLKAADQAKDLVQQLLAFSRKAMIKPLVLDLNNVIESFTSVLQRTVGEVVLCEFALDSNTAKVKVDYGQIEQILMNLAVNARDAMPAGGKLKISTSDVTLDEDYVKTHPDTEPGKYVVLSVADTGCGMDEQALTHVFEPFYTTKGLAVGTGLGLSSVYGIVKQSGGHVEVSSEVNRGTTFVIYLPTIQQPQDTAESLPL